MRRTFLAFGRGLFLLLAVVLAAGAAQAQSNPQSNPRIGFLSAYSSESATRVVEGLKRELATLGWTDGRIEWLEPVATNGRFEDLPALAATMAAANPALIVAISADVVRALKQVTTTIPVVMLAVGEPVEYGLVASLSRPGGNVTGTAGMVNDVGPKLLQILREAAPHVREVAVPANPANPGAEGYWRTISAAAPALGLKLHRYNITTDDSVAATLAAMRAFGIDGMLLVPEARVIALRARFTAFAVEQRIAVIQHGPLNLLGPGILATGGPASGDYIRVTAGYVDKILKGTRPADLPIWRPVAFELGVNLKAAEALGITLPQNLVVRADRVVEE